MAMAARPWPVIKILPILLAEPMAAWPLAAAQAVPTLPGRVRQAQAAPARLDPAPVPLWPEALQRQPQAVRAELVLQADLLPAAPLKVALPPRVPPAGQVEQAELARREGPERQLPAVLMAVQAAMAVLP